MVAASEAGAVDKGRGFSLLAHSPHHHPRKTTIPHSAPPH
jgi:hypothetical protein